MPNATSKVVSKAGRLVFRGGRKLVSQPKESLLLLRMAFWVFVLSIATRIYSLPKALELVSGNADATCIENDMELANHLATSIDLLLSMNILMFRPICWKRAAVLRRYLSQNGIPTKIIFGVRNETEGKVDGHAWLEVNGEPILESTPPEYVVTYRFPSSDRFDPRLASITAD